MDMEAWLDDVRAVKDKDVLIQLYKMATDEPHGFSYIKLTATSVKDMFYASLRKTLAPKDVEDSNDDFV